MRRGIRRKIEVRKTAHKASLNELFQRIFSSPSQSIDRLVAFENIMKRVPEGKKNIRLILAGVDVESKEAFVTFMKNAGYTCKSAQYSHEKGFLRVSFVRT